jgi:hypothetical protein
MNPSHKVLDTYDSRTAGFDPPRNEETGARRREGDLDRFAASEMPLGDVKVEFVVGQCGQPDRESVERDIEDEADEILRRVRY